MADLSPQAQAVMHTYEDWLELPIANQRYGPLAAALRAAADQVVPDLPKPSADSDYHLMNWSKSLDQYYQRQQTRAELLAIAAELERAGAE